MGISAGIIFVATLISRLTGFLREVVMAAYFGTSALNDAWLMASVLPNLLFSTMNGAISVTVVPLMTQADAQLSKRSVQNFINEVFTAIVLVSTILIVFGEIFAPELMRLVAPGFHHKELALTVSMTRIMIPTILFWGLAGLVVGILQEREEFLYPALSPVAINVVRIATIVTLGHFFSIQGVAMGFLLSVLSQLFVTVPALKRAGLHLHFRWHFSHPLLRKMIRMSGPFFLTSSVGTLGVIVDRILASSLVTGSLAALNYSYVLVQIPVGLLISSLTTPIYTRLAQHQSHHDLVTYRQLAMRGFRLVILIIVPITLWFMILSIPILRLIYQHGAFSNYSTRITASTLLFWSIGLPGFGLSFYLQKLFFATQDTKSPARFSIITILFNIVGDLILVRFLQADGLALATALAAWVNTTLLTIKALNPRHNSDLLFRPFVLKIGITAGITAIVVYGLREWFSLDYIHGFFPLAFALTSTIVVSALVYLTLLTLFRFPEIRELLRRLLKNRHNLQSSET
ncbi:putative peptidoglycan lipid II flippase [Sulfobacillus thermosulfidooxidans DSM 9293]|uniref:Probable lipid II flippase MurJ n=1 Tax=Sulfobacillus thermosulfidooxidans (strain DSM 9293 / VKM B-1269 / AT-1) TaxID=929705 RepID=A0A1W1WLY8_SULTA|nr:putative peptidoglycan lipid II flippase [Sulfobacillus thermosulfidooxidans DSM 9293]